jgi:hypothetical protein
MYEFNDVASTTHQSLPQVHLDVVDDYPAHVVAAQVEIESKP